MIGVLIITFEELLQQHIQKICGFFQAMREFSSSLRSDGHEILYLTLDETIQYSEITQLLDELVDRYQIETFEYQLPDEYRLDEQEGDIDNLKSVVGYNSQSVKVAERFVWILVSAIVGIIMYGYRG